MMEKKEKAIDRPVRLSDGTETSLAAFWQETPLVLVFLRHFG